MRNIAISILFLFAFVTINLAQEVNCLPCAWPFPPNPPCKEKCADTSFASITRAELRLFFALDADVAQKIVDLNKKLLVEGKTPSLEMYKELKALTPDEITIFKIRLESLTEKDMYYLLTPPEDKQKQDTRLKMEVFYQNVDAQRLMIDRSVHNPIFKGNIEKKILDKPKDKGPR